MVGSGLTVERRSNDIIEGSLRKVRTESGLRMSSVVGRLPSERRYRESFRFKTWNRMFRKILGGDILIVYGSP